MVKIIFNAFIAAVDKYHQATVIPERDNINVLIKNELIPENVNLNDIPPLKLKNSSILNSYLNQSVKLTVSYRSYELISTLSHNLGEKIKGNYLKLLKVDKK